MAFQDNQELRRVAQVLRECSSDQIVNLLRQANLGLNRQEKNVYILDLREEDEYDEDEDDCDED